MVNELDVKEAARLGMHTRPLTTAVVQQHLADLGVDPEFGTHSHMRGLSGEPPASVVLLSSEQGGTCRPCRLLSPVIVSSSLIRDLRFVDAAGEREEYVVCSRHAS